MVVVKKEGVLLTPKDFKPTTRGFEVTGCFNPGVLQLRSGDILLYVRVVERPLNWKRKNYVYGPRFVSNTDFKIKLDKFNMNLIRSIDEPLGFNFKDGTLRLTYISHIRRVLLDSSGFNVKHIEQRPCFYGTPKDGELGVEDPRITNMTHYYVMTYVSLSRYNSVSTSCVFSKYGYKWNKRGIIFRHQNKDVVVFPDMIRRRYVAFNRPEGNFEFSLPHMWLSYSKDLRYWGDDRTILLSKEGWDSTRIGAGAPPLRLKEGWLEFYHGVKIKHLGETGRSLREYCVGVALFDLRDPSKLISKSVNPFLEPSHPYEKHGVIHDVVFPTGAILNHKTKSVLLFSGGGDRVTIVREIELKEIFDHLKMV